MECLNYSTRGGGNHFNECQIVHVVFAHNIHGELSFYKNVGHLSLALQVERSFSLKFYFYLSTDPKTKYYTRVKSALPEPKFYFYKNCKMAVAISSPRADSASVPGVAFKWV